MDSHLVIVSKNGENPLISSIDPVNQQNLEIGIKSVLYGGISQNYFEFLVNGKRYILPIHLDEYEETEPTKIKLFDDFLVKLTKFASTFKLPSPLVIKQQKAAVKNQSLSFGLTGAEGVQILHVPRILKAKKGFSRNGISEWVYKNTAINWKVETKQDITTQPGFIYCNLIENSYLNGHRSKLLQVIPFDFGEDAYSLDELLHPNYTPIQVNQFSYLEFTIRDLKGELIKFSSYHDIVLTLHIRGV
eukprot:sb/3468889/